MESVDPALFCIGCRTTFRSSSGRSNHQQQSKKCRWVYDLQNHAPPAPIRNYLADPGEQDEDPPRVEDLPDTAVAEDQEIFAVYDEIPTSRQPSPSTATPTSHIPSPDSEPNPFYDPSHRARTEDELDAAPAESKQYPGAAKVLRYDLNARAAYQANSAPSPNPYHPFSSRLDWQIAQWAKEEDVAQNAFTRLLAIPGVCEKLGLSYHDSRSLNQTIDELPGSTAWQSAPVSVEYSTSGKISTDFFFRDALECVKTLYSNPAFVEYMMFAPEQQFSDTSKEHRLYNEMNTGDWWWRTQAKLPDGATVLPIILSSDKTQLTAFNQDQSAYPIYLTIGNIAKHIRRKPSFHAQILIGYLPTPDFSGMSDDIARVVRARLFHSVLTVITQSLQEAGHDGIDMKSGDGAVRHCHPILACYVADYPEQSLVSCTRQNSRCPKCHAAEIEFELNGISWTPRTQKATLRTLARAAKESVLARQEAALKEAGLTNVVSPFWEHLAHCDIHNAITPDILHQLYQGMIMYLIEWVTSIIGATELDARFKRLPKTHGVRLFTNGISSLTRVSAGERKEICKQLLGCVVGKAPPGIVRATRAMLDFLHIAMYESHSDETLNYLQAALDEFHRDKKLFADLKARTSRHFNLPKLHSLQHYVNSIREIGTLDNCNTETTERLHIEFAKDAYGSTNKKDYLTQMIWWLDRRERINLFDTHLRWRQGTLPPLRLPRRSEPGLSLAKSPNHRAVAFPALVEDYHARHFSRALKEFISDYCDLSGRQRDNIAIPFHTVEVWDRIKFQLKNLQLDDGPTFQDTAVAMPAKGNKEGQFDTVLVAVGETDETGVNGLRVGRLRIIFRLPKQFDRALFRSRNVSPPDHLAYVEWYSPFTRPKANHRMYQVTSTGGLRLQDVSIIEVSDIKRSCQLIPEFGDRVNWAWTSQNVLDRCKNLFVNNFVDKHMYQSIW